MSLVRMPRMGKNAASGVAASLNSSFRALQVAFIVGIYGACPQTKKEEVIMGDVVLSEGIVEYDFGRQFPDRFVRKAALTESLGSPNLEIRSLMAKLKGLRARNQPGCALAQGMIPRHRLQLSPDGLQKEPDPKVHFGLIASGDTVMKSGQHRDIIASRENVIAFEMESAGAWDHLPCVLIKGVCDYADRNKSDTWHTYAAVTAAAVLKALLEAWPGSNPPARHVSC